MHYSMSTVQKLINDHQNLDFDYPYQDIYLIRLLQTTTDALAGHFENNFAKYQLNDMRLLMLLAIQSKHEHGIRPSELSHLFHISRVNITRQLDAMTKNGWIERKMDPNDRRSQQLFLTLHGQQFLKQVATPLQQHLIKVLSCISQDEKNVLFNILKKLNNQITNDQPLE